MKTELEKRDGWGRALETLLAMSEAHKSALIAMHEAEKTMLIFAKKLEHGGYAESKGLNPIGVVHHSFCNNIKTGEVKDSILDFINNDKINKIED